MVEDSPIVQDTRRVRRAISRRSGNDPDRYIDYLMSRTTVEQHTPRTSRTVSRPRELAKQ